MPVDQKQPASLADRSGWPRARLIPTVGIRNREEQEKRASSCLLAVMRAVPDFGHALLKELGAPKAPVIETFTEVRFKDAADKSVIPDGAIVCERGKRSWTCLVEVKTAGAPLKPEQVSAYLDVARDNGFDGVLTISNDITASVTETPVDVDGRKLRRTKLWHLSWWRIVTEAVVQSRYRGVSDSDQAWILDELIAYLQHPASGAGGFEDMGDQWVSVRSAARDGTLRASDAAAREVARHWQEFTQYMALTLSQELGRAVSVVQKGKSSAAALLDESVRRLAAEGALDARLRVPDAVGDLRIAADLRAKQTRTSVTLVAPKEGRPLTRINWLIRQLDGAPADLRVEVAYPNARETVSELLGAARDSPELLLYSADRKREPRTFTLTLSRPMGQKRGRAEGSFVRETRAQTIAFYGELVQNLKAWQPRAPKLREEPGDAESTAGDSPVAQTAPPVNGQPERSSVTPAGAEPDARQTDRPTQS